MAAVKQKPTGLFQNKSKWGYIDETGKLIIPLQYDTAQPFESFDNPKGEYALVNKNGEVFYINKKGQKLKEFPSRLAVIPIG